MKQFTFFVAGFLFCCYTIFFASSCANIIPPGGGAKDTLAPILVSALPKDSAINFTAKKITLTFNEFVELRDLQTNLIVSPIPKNAPIIESKLKTITIKLRDSLEQNTTYSINFGSSIKDVNEGNSFKEFTYVFATGNSLDNGSFSGKVFLAENGKIDSTLIVVLYKNLSDTAVLKTTPKYYTKILGDGSFSFANLPNTTFNAFVMPNEYSKKYDDSTKIFAFLPQPININQSSNPVVLYAYQQEKKKQTTPTTNTTTTATIDRDKRLRYNTSLENYRQDLLSKNLFLDFNKKIKQFNANKIVLTDTNYNPITNYSILLDSTEKRIVINNQWQPDFYYKLIIQKDALADSTGTTLLKADTIRFASKKETEYGTVKISFSNLNSIQHPVLQIVKENVIIESIPILQKEFNRKLFTPGDYELRLLYDDNNNGIWDAGNYNKKILPEIVKKLTKKLSVRANWDNENEIVL